MGRHAEDSQLCPEQGDKLVIVHDVHYLYDLCVQIEVTSHLASSSPREGVVQEYISWECGVIRMLDGDKAVALFSLENVWTTHEGEFKPLR